MVILEDFFNVFGLIVVLIIAFILVDVFGRRIPFLPESIIKLFIVLCIIIYVLKLIGIVATLVAG